MKKAYIMKKNLLNEIARMRKMMGLNENEGVDLSKVDNPNAYTDDIFDYNSEKGGEDMDDFSFEKSAIESASGEEVVQREFDDYDRPLFYSVKDDNVHYFIGDFGDGEVIVKYNAKTGERYPIGDLKHYDSPRELDEDSDDSDEDTVGIITNRGKLMPGYFEKLSLVSAGDSMLFDKKGNVVLQGGGYPEGGFKEYTDPKELEKDICNNYEKIIKAFRASAPKTVQLNEGYDVIKKNVECDLTYESLEEGNYEIDPTYTHFAVNNQDGKIYNGWEYDSDMDKPSILYYCKIDLKDMDLNPKDFKIMTKKYLLSSNLDPFDSNNWKSNN